MKRLFLVVLLVGCAKKPAPSSLPSSMDPEPVAMPEPSRVEAVGGPWTHALLADHTLVGRIWSTAEGRFVDEAAVLSALEGADYRLLGEKHDNADHHRLQGRVIAALGPSAVAFEQLDDEDPVGEADGPEALAEAVGWEESGWPEFAVYAPVFQAVYDAEATVLTAHPTRQQLMGSARAGMDSLGDALEGLALDRELDEGQKASLSEEIVEAHCGHADHGMVQMMIGMQVLKDAWMARALTRSGPGTVLVAGNGHTRTDRGVPHYLDGSVVSLSFREVADGELQPAAYEEPADFVWFTPRVDDVDPCEKFKDSLESMGHGAEEAE